MKTYKDGLRDGVKFAVEWEEHYDWNRKFSGEIGQLPLSDALTHDHEFGKHVLIMKPRGTLSPKSANHLAQRFRAISASAVVNFSKQEAPLEADNMADARELRKRLEATVQRAEDGAGTLPARESVKVRPADWHALIDQATGSAEAAGRSCRPSFPHGRQWRKAGQLGSVGF